jgi:hypothetical protein
LTATGRGCPGQTSSWTTAAWGRAAATTRGEHKEYKGLCGLCPCWGSECHSLSCGVIVCRCFDLFTCGPLLLSLPQV